MKRHIGKFLIEFVVIHNVNKLNLKLRSLQWLRGPNKNVELELETIRANIHSTMLRSNPFPAITTNKVLTTSSFQTVYSNIKSVLKNARIIKPVSITCGLMVFQRFTGMYNKQRNHFYFLYHQSMHIKKQQIYSYFISLLL